MSHKRHHIFDTVDIPDDLAAATSEEAGAFARLIGLIRRLRGPQGCPWDREQTLRTMTPYIIEETYEVIDAIERDDDADLREEIGDLVFLLVFCLDIAREDGRFTLDASFDAHVRKMIVRHPHVFANSDIHGSGQAATQWEEIKQREKSERSSVLDGRLASLPALTGAYRVQEKVAAVGFDWQRVEEVLDKVAEEIGEVREALAARRQASPGAPGVEPAGAEAGGGEADAPSGAAQVARDDDQLRAEIGDLLFTLVNLARFLAVDPEAALRGTTARFMTRFRHIERRLAEAGRRPTDATLDEMDELWEEAKRLERGPAD
jgi:MazG family protein